MRESIIKSIRLILTVQRCPVIYVKTLSHDYHLQEDLWENIAKRCNLHCGYEANRMWLDLVKGYIEYLRDGTEYEYVYEMLFLQSHLITVHSDSEDIDEEELQRILDSDSDTSNSNSTPVKRKETASTSQEPKVKKRKRARRTKAMKGSGPENTKPKSTADSSSTAETPSTASSNVAELSSLQLIFLGYAKVLQDLPLPIQVKTKHKIAQIINEAEMSLCGDDDDGDSTDSEK